jgi:beta-phosphoglucomutase-like phosphatase (HAD superfamily)
LADCGLIFDFDGTICLSEPAHMDAWVTVARSCGLPLPEHFIENGVGVADARIASDLEDFWREAGAEPILTAGEALDRKCREFRSRDGSGFPLVAGVLSFLERMKGIGIPMALATSSSVKDIDSIFAAHNLHQYFSGIFTIESVTRAKPDPEIYLQAIQALGTTSPVFVFEDSIPGVTAARAAGAHVIGISTAHTPDELAPLHGYIDDYCDHGMLFRLLGMTAAG